MAKNKSKTERKSPEERLKALQEQVNRRAEKAKLRKEINEKRAALKKL